MNVILASSSPYRAQQLTALGIRFEVALSDFNEDDFKRSFSGSPYRLACELARAKAESVAKNRGGGAVVIGADQLVVFENQILGKPGDAARCMAQLERLRGKTHELITALCVWHQNESWTETNLARVTMASLNSEQIRRYVERDQPWDCAGGYKVEQGGPWIIERIETSDPTAIVGLPLMALSRRLRDLGCQIEVNRD